MPRGARLDAPGLHHVIVRGIERRNIVDDDNDQENFVSRMGAIAIGYRHSYLCLGTNDQSRAYFTPQRKNRFADIYPSIAFRLRHIIQQKTQTIWTFVSK